MTREMTINTVRELIDFLKNLNPEMEISCFDSQIGMSKIFISANEIDGVVFEAKD